MNDIVGKSRKRKSLPQQMEGFNDDTLTDPGEIASNFVKCFTNVGPNLAKIVPKSSCDLLSYMGEHMPCSMYVKTLRTS